MKANNLSISVPYHGCDKKCPYCVSRMTGVSIPHNRVLWNRNLRKALKMAETAQITSVSITGKGEPTISPADIEIIGDVFKDYPIELQTNGIRLSKSLRMIDDLLDWNVDIVAFSIDNLEQFETLKPVFEKINEYGMTNRVTINLTDQLPHPNEMSFHDYINKCKELSIHQLTFRNITKANHTEKNEIHDWIDSHVTDQYSTMIKQITEVLNDESLGLKSHFIRKLPFGAKLFDVEGIAVTAMDYCIQDSNAGHDIRSLIFMEDGHLYTSWNSQASRIF